MKKVMYLKAEAILEDEKECVKLRFQNYKIENGELKPDNTSDIIIYRREDNGCDFNCDGLEYYDGLTPCADDVIFNGILVPQNTISEFIDKDVELHKTYVYWVGKGEIGKCISGPVVAKIRDTKIWWHYDTVVEQLEMLQKPGYSEVITIGHTVQNIPIKALLIGSRENMVACVGAVHAGESGPEILVSAARYIIENHSDLTKKVGLAIVPTVNIDNREKLVKGHPTYLRVNVNGVDLNRNFDAFWEETSEMYGLSTEEPMCATYKGPFAESESETKALVNFIKSTKPKCVFSYHWMCSVSSDCLLGARPSKGDDEFIKKLEKISKIYSDAYRTAINFKKKESNYFSSGVAINSFINWLYLNGIPAFDLEMEGDLSEAFFKNNQFDKTTQEMLDISTRGHTQGIIKIMEYLDEVGL